jgi:K+-sensing histidine kinase KdpD
MDFNSPAFIKQQLDSTIKTSRVCINRIISAVVIAEQSEVLQDEVIADLVFNSCKLLAQNMNMMFLYSDDLLAESAKTELTIDVRERLHSILAESSRLLSVINRDVLFVTKVDSSLARIDEKLFTLLVMNLLQNALLYSPAKSAVIVELDNLNDFLCVSFTNLRDIEKFKEVENSKGLGISLCTKIAEHHGGELEFLEIEGKITAELYLPLTASENGQYACLSADWNDYVGERFKPVNLFMQEVLYNNT